MTDAVGRGPGFTCCGVRIDAASPEQARQILLESQFGVPRAVHLCNAFTLSLAVRDPSYRDTLNRSDRCFADGQPVAFVGRRLGHRQMYSSVRGPALMQDILDKGQASGLRHYFYGSTPEVGALLARVVKSRYPAAKVVGIEAPPFRSLTPEERTSVVQRVRDAQPDIVWVGLGTPRQDLFLEEFRGQIDATLVAIGAGFDFLAGTKRTAPELVQRLGLEWLFRLISEPRRLWKRYLFGNAVFVRRAWQDLRTSQRL
jgi:N-acetylglucosaminyldiphosphoundecaprenol N-acetyl-beta-D-mannosaminyltransferase